MIKNYYKIKCCLCPWSAAQRGQSARRQESCTVVAILAETAGQEAGQTVEVSAPSDSSNTSGPAAREIKIKLLKSRRCFRFSKFN